MRHVAKSYVKKNGKVVDGRVSRVVTSPEFGELVVTIAPEGVYLREQGRRTAFLSPYDLLYQRTVSDTIETERDQKARARRARKRRNRRGKL